MKYSRVAASASGNEVIEGSAGSPEGILKR